MTALNLAADGGDTAASAAAVVVEEAPKTPRLPRWTRQEILVLIEGKRVVESRVRRGRATFGAGQVEPKWSSVSSYCKRHGVNRGPVQCRKRWSNLAGDYKKIKEWEAQIKDESESFWLMRNDLRRERKLPGFFDREVYDILQGNSPIKGLVLALGPAQEVDADAEIVFDSGRTAAAAAETGLFSDEEEPEENESPPRPTITPMPVPTRVAAPVPISEKVYQPHSSSGQGAGNEKEPLTHQEGGSSSQEARKRKRYTVENGDVETNTLSLEEKLIDMLERNGKMLHSQLEAQNNNLQLDREQRKNNATNLLQVLNKMADAMVKIAEKL